MARICVVGLWHQASVLSACLADLGHQVCGVGDDPGAVRALAAGRAPVRERRLNGILRRNLKAGRLRYLVDYGEALREAEFAYLALDTPVDAEDRSDLDPVFAAADRMGANLSGDLILCVTAQVPVGTCEELAARLARQAPRFSCRVVYVPEFLRLNAAVEHFRRADRIIIGAQDPGTAARVAELYAPLKRPLRITGLRTAEMAKHASNAFLAASISFINEIADLCEVSGADALEVARAMKLDRRIGTHAFLSPGLGFAGGTLGREIRSLQQLARRRGRSTALLDAVMTVNLARPRRVAETLRRLYPSLDGLQAGVLGLTYKPGTSTLRRSAAFEIIAELTAAGVRIQAYDPLANLSEAPDGPPFQVCPDPYTAAGGSDALVLITEWPGIGELDLARLRDAMRRPVLLDTRNFFDPERMRELGFLYFGIGRGGASDAAQPAEHTSEARP